MEFNFQRSVEEFREALSALPKDVAAPDYEEKAGRVNDTSMAFSMQTPGISQDQFNELLGMMEYCVERVQDHELEDGPAGMLCRSMQRRIGNFKRICSTLGLCDKPEGMGGYSPNV